MRLGKAYDRGIIHISWICVTIIVALVSWMSPPKYLGWDIIFFILLLYGMSFVLTIGDGLFDRESVKRIQKFLPQVIKGKHKR